MAEVDVRKGMPPVELSREEFEKRYRRRFVDPVFNSVERELAAVIAAAWDAYRDSRKAPLTRKAGPGFADPDYEIAFDWFNARDAILAAQRRHDDADEPSRILLINGSSRSEHTCQRQADPSLQGVCVYFNDALPLAVQLLPKLFAGTDRRLDERNLSALGGRARRHDRNADKLVSGADRPEGHDGPLGLCRWRQPDPSSTHGKKAAEAKELELRGWPYPRHLAGRYFGLVIHGDSVGAEMLRQSIAAWLTDMSLISAGRMAEADGYIGYMEPYAIPSGAGQR